MEDPTKRREARDAHLRKTSASAARLCVSSRLSRASNHNPSFRRSNWAQSAKAPDFWRTDMGNATVRAPAAVLLLGTGPIVLVLCKLSVLRSSTRLEYILSHAILSVHFQSYTGADKNARSTRAVCRRDAEMITQRFSPLSAFLQVFCLGAEATNSMPTLIRFHMLEIHYCVSVLLSC